MRFVKRRLFIIIRKRIEEEEEEAASQSQTLASSSIGFAHLGSPWRYAAWRRRCGSSSLPLPPPGFRRPLAFRRRPLLGPSPSPPPPPPPPSRGELENALRVKNNIESAKEVDLFSSADVLTKHRQQAEQTIRQISESYGRVSKRMHKNLVRFACASVVVALLDWYCFQDEDEILEREIELLLRDE